MRLGQASVEQAFEQAGQTLQDVSLRPVLERFALPQTEDDLYDAVGRGRIIAQPGAGSRSSRA